MRRRSPALLAAALAVLLVGTLLARIVATTRWTMDADEAVHAVEALRLHDDLAAGDVPAFLRHTWLPERWQPPVNPHVRWYPFVHAWALLPLFGLLGPSDATARLPSVVFLLATAFVFFHLGRRLAPAPREGGGEGRREAAGLAAALLVLASPNLLTFSAQSLVESCALLVSYAALLAYLRSLERGHPPGRAVAAGLLLAAAILTKYDHGGVLAVCLGLAELVRVRFRPLVLLRSGGGLLLACGLVPTALWFAHPAKLAALADSAAHPFEGTPRVILLDFFLTGLVEYGASLAIALGGWWALAAWTRRLREPHVRAVWLWAVLGTAFYALRGRYHFRYNFVEAPVLLLALGTCLPAGAARFGEALSRARRAGPAVLGLLLALLGLAAGLSVRSRPERAFEALRGPFDALVALRADRFGLHLPPDHYVDFFRDEYASFAAFLGESLAALSAGAALLAGAWLLARRSPPAAARARAVLPAAFLVAAVPGAVRVFLELRPRVEWELEGHPELNDVHAFVDANAPAGTTVLLGGGWDQLSNNALRWYRATRGEHRDRLADVPVVGDMIGSIVFPPEPRIAHWATLLATAPHAELPERVVLVEPGPRFLYHERFGPEVAIYDDVIARRGSHAELARRRFPRLDCVVRVLARTAGSEPIPAPDALLAAHGIAPGVEATARRWEGEGGWETKDESLRHFRARRPTP